MDKAIGEAITKFKKEDIEPSVTQIISEVLNLETLLQLSPISFVSELQKAMNPTASRSKLPSNNDVEDMAIEARERVETVKERLRLRLAEIDREIESLEKSPAAQTSQTDLQDRMTEQIADAIKPSAKKYLSKEQVKTKVATQFIGEGVKASSTDRYHKMYQSEGVANTGKYNSSDIIYVSSNGARGNRVNPVVDGELQGKFKNIDKAIKAGAAFIMDTYDHLVKTRKYNIGELALGNYVKSKGYKRVGRSGMWTKDGKAPQPAAQGQKPKAESLKPGAEGEVSQLTQKRLVESYLNFVAPEEASIDWMNVPHNLMSYRRYRMVKGNEVKEYSPDMPKPEPVTLGMLATMRSWQNNEDKGLPYPLIDYKVQGQKKDISEDTRTPQEYLWDYVNHEFKPPKTDKKDIPKPFYGGKSENEYRMILEAVKASAMLPKQQNIATESLGDARWEVEAGVKQEARRGYPSGYMSEKGTNFGLLIAKESAKKGLKGVEQKEIERPTLSSTWSP